MDEQDPVVQEIPVYLSQALADTLSLLQYPLRPAYMPFDGATIKNARIRPNHGDMELDVAIETKGSHYSRSRGEQYARLTEVELVYNGTLTVIQSGLMDQQTLSSNIITRKTDPRYIAGVLKDGELHLTPLKSVIQLRPTLRHIEIGDSTGANKVPGGAQSDGDTTATESEEEEAKPVTVRFARGGIKHKQQHQTVPDEQWQTAIYHSMESAEATEERQLLFGTVEDHSHLFTCTSHDYLNQLCPVETSQQNDSPGQCGPSGVLSLTKLKTLPLEKQVTEFMKKAIVLPFDRVCTVLGRVRQERESVLDDLQRCAILVQGCWVVHSSLVLSKELRNARDYVLWCFTKNPVLTRKDLTSVLKITSPQLRELLQPVAVFKAGSGWHFKQATDSDFIANYPLVVESQKAWWEKRHKEVILSLGIGVSPESNQQSQGGHISGQQLVSIATQKAKDKSTPSRQHPLPPGQIIKTDVIEMDTVTLDNIPTDVVDSLKTLLVKTMGKNCVAIEKIKSEVLMHVTSFPETDQLRQITISNGLILSVLSLVGVVNIGEPYNKQVYAVKNVGETLTDQYREVILEMFKSSRGLKRKQLIEEITKRHEQCDNKILTAILKELCQCKGGGVWSIKGLD